MSGSDSNKDSITEVAEESFVRERPLEIERGAVLAGRYQVEEVIGRGGSGVVLRVFDRTVQNVVALKVLKSELARDAKWDKRFSRELRLGRPIQHPNVCRIFDIGEADGHRFLTMELATGGSLRDELKRRPALERPVEDRLADARAAIDGLAAIHAMGVVHRDFKPDNLLRMDDGRLVISDFGLATDAANAPGVTVMIGTPHYMAPEVLAGEPATTRSDVWALGVVLHEITFGRRPERKTVSFDGSQSRPIGPQSRLERRILALCEACLAESPAERPADAQAVARELQAVLTDQRPGRRNSPRWRRISLIGVGAIATVVLVRVVHKAGVDGGPATSQLVATGPHVDLTSKTRVLAELNGAAACFSAVDARTLRVIWGNPRRAEDIDVQTGRRVPADLLPETYQVDCPQVRGHSLLFTGRSPLGAADIRLSRSRNGQNAQTLTSGSEPLWLRDEDTFVYTIDWDHAAIFSIAPATFELLPDPQLGPEYGIKDKAVGAGGDQVAVLYSDLVRDAVVIYDRHVTEQKRIRLAREAARIGFSAGSADRLFILGIDDTPEVVASQLDWKEGRLTRLGRIPGFDFKATAAFPDGLGLLAIDRVRNVWRNSPGPPAQLTFDGDAYSAATSADGRLLVSRRGDAGRLTIWLYRPAERPLRLTNGPVDVEPVFAPDGDTWGYADYASRSVMVCSLKAGSCRTLHSSVLLPTFPSFSPDGQMLVFMTQLKTTTFTVISVEDGHALSSWQSSDRCPPRWSPDRDVITVERSSGGYVWARHDPVTGARRAEEHQSVWKEDCQRDGAAAGPTSPRIEIRSHETSRVLVLP